MSDESMYPMAKVAAKLRAADSAQAESKYSSDKRAITYKLDQMDVRAPDQQVTSMNLYPLRAFAMSAEERRTQIRAYYLESCLTALLTNDRPVAVRAMVQAYAYSGIDEGAKLGSILCGERDYLIAVRNRIEAWISDGVRSELSAMKLAEVSE